MMACKQCPFRTASKLAYDADAMECLDDGGEPACHARVGLDAIFAHVPLPPPEGAKCLGYEAWLAGDPGFQRPAQTKGS